MSDFVAVIPQRDAARIHEKLGVHFAAVNDFVKAEEQFRCSVSIREILERSDYGSITETLLLLANTLIVQRRFCEARPVCKRVIDAIESAKPAIPEVQLLLATGYAHMSAALRGMGNKKCAERMFGQAAKHGHRGSDFEDPIPIGGFNWLAISGQKGQSEPTQRAAA